VSDLKYRLYGRLQWLYHTLRGRNMKKTYNVCYMYDHRADVFENNECVVNGQRNINGSLFFKGDNIVEGVKPRKQGKLSICRQSGSFSGEELWLRCILSAKVEAGWKNSGFYLTAYIKEKKQWCLSSWIWTSAAIARVLSKCDFKEEAKSVADTFLKEQLPEGGWVVRYDFINGHLNRLAAPNDSAYIARNALLTAYYDTMDLKYLNGAEKCAKWIMDTSCEDGLVLFGYDVDKAEWIRNRNIVDIGFTADLFAELYKITENENYKEFLTKFIHIFVDTFYDASAGLFASHVNGERKQNGGFFSRGQAWAMEGLISAYSVLGDDKLFGIMERLTESIVKNQLNDGGWYCNFQKSRILMGEDCKGVSAIAGSLLDWAKYSRHKDMLVASAKEALKWCKTHTDSETGMILSFSCNGAIAHSPNTSTGMLYANAYAIEVHKKLNAFQVKDV